MRRDVRDSRDVSSELSIGTEFVRGSVCGGEYMSNIMPEWTDQLRRNMYHGDELSRVYDESNVMRRDMRDGKHVSGVRTERDVMRGSVRCWKYVSGELSVRTN